VTLTAAYELLSNREQLESTVELLEDLLPMPRRLALQEHFNNRFLNQPDDSLEAFAKPSAIICNIFVPGNCRGVFATTKAVRYRDVDSGKVICVTMPQKFQTERRYVNTFLKLLFYNHALRRFDRSKTERANDNLIILWADEAQRFMTASEDGTSDTTWWMSSVKPGRHHCRRSVHDLIHSPLGNDKVQSADVESPQPDDFSRRRRAGRRAKRGFSRQKTRRETLLGPQCRQEQP